MSVLEKLFVFIVAKRHPWGMGWLCYIQFYFTFLLYSELNDIEQVDVRGVLTINQFIDDYYDNLQWWLNIKQI